jgi:hypothetical protein
MLHLIIGRYNSIYTSNYPPAYFLGRFTSARTRFRHVTCWLNIPLGFLTLTLSTTLPTTIAAVVLLPSTSFQSHRRSGCFGPVRPYPEWPPPHMPPPSSPGHAAPPPPPPEHDQQATVSPCSDLEDAAECRPPRCRGSAPPCGRCHSPSPLLTLPLPRPRLTPRPPKAHVPSPCHSELVAPSPDLLAGSRRDAQPQVQGKLSSLLCSSSPSHPLFFLSLLLSVNLIIDVRRMWIEDCCVKYAMHLPMDCRFICVSYA